MISPIAHYPGKETPWPPAAATNSKPRRRSERYQRQKVTIAVVSTVPAPHGSTFGFVFGPQLATFIRRFRTNAGCVLASAAFLGISLELLTALLDFYSSFILEHRYHLSNQTFAGWLWSCGKGYLVAGTLGLLLITGFTGCSG